MKIETREEYEREYNILRDMFKDSNALLNKNLLILDNSFIKSLEQQNTELQARIKELEELKTCDGCKWNGSVYEDWSEHCGNCARNVIQEDDMFEKNDTK